MFIAIFLYFSIDVCYVHAFMFLLLFLDDVDDNHLSQTFFETTDKNVSQVL